ncbi:MAG: hypothetical protein IRY89_07960 [Pseudolabrys sp.]|nr:hypothetical protein [Pseudolabrys sp.]
MLRKVALAAGLAAAFGIVALAPTGASAFPWKYHHHHHFHGVGFGIGLYPAYDYIAEPDCYVVKRPVKTPFGWRLRRFTVCD